MAGGGVDRLGHSRCGAIALAIIRRAQIRAAFHHSSRNLHVRRPRVVTLFGLSTTRIETRATSLFDLAVLLIPVDGPLPNIPGHVVKPISIRRKRSDRRGPFVTI